MIELTISEIEKLIIRIAPHLGYDLLCKPVFLEGRKDVCAVRYTTEDGRQYGFDVIYCVWKNPAGDLQYREIQNSRKSKDYIYIDSVTANKDGSVSIRLASTGSYSGIAWSETLRMTIPSGEVQQEVPKSFAEEARRAMINVVGIHQHPHPLFKPTIIKESVIDEQRGIAAFILFEQIDTDRISADGEGWLGD